jgi:hypothetical protein
MNKPFAAAAVLVFGLPLAAHPEPLARFAHVYAVFDDETAKVVASSAYLRDFSGLVAKTTREDEGHYHGRYILGRESYVELFGPADYDLDEPPAAVGLIGIGLNSEHVGGLERLKSAVEGKGQ